MRQWARTHARWLFTNPDMLHLGLLRGHARWSRLLRNLRYVVVDECHAYRGVFGSNVRWCCAGCAGSRDVTARTRCSYSRRRPPADPGGAAARLIGAPCAEVTEDGSPHGPRTVALWEPPLLAEVHGRERRPGAPRPRVGGSRIMADLVIEGARTLTFVRSRRGAELTAMGAARLLGEAAPELAGGSPPTGRLSAEDRRALETALSDGSLLGAATTNALELGVDIAGLDAVVVAGFPGTRASLWQQAGRSGRRGEGPW